MKLRRVRVKNFRCIEDSTEFTVAPVTCLVGKNGAGKTSLLDALYKLNPDVEELAQFDALMEYPRARRRQYQKRADRQPDDALITTWELEDRDVQDLERTLGPGAVKSRTVVIEKGYYPGRKWAGALGTHGATPFVPTPVEQYKPVAQAPQEDAGATDEQIRGLTQIADAGADAAVFAPAQEQQDLSGRAAPPQQTPRTTPADSDRVFFERHLAGLLPKLLYFSEWHMMQGRISMDALLQRKQKGELTGPDRVFLALLELGGTSVEALTSIERSEELIADLEDASRPITDEIGAYWSQERDLQVSFHLYPGRPGDPTPFDRGLVFETRIVNRRTNLSLNFEERSTGFVWFFSFLVWYSEVRKRYGDNLIILLDDPGLGLHPKAQWDLLRYIYEKLAPRYPILYATHSPFMVDPDRIQWVRTVEEIVEQVPSGSVEHVGTKVGDEVLSTDPDTLVPLQASLGYRIMQDLADSKRMLLVERPADMLYLEWFSARLNERGRSGLNPAWTIVPCGDIVRLATLAGLLANEASGFAVLLHVPEAYPDVVEQRELARIFQRCHVFPLRKYAEPVESTVEDLIGAPMYTALVDLCYRIPRRDRLSGTLKIQSGTPVVRTVREVFASGRPAAGNFDALIPAEFLLKSNNKKLRRLPGLNEALARFETLFADVNAAL